MSEFHPHRFPNESKAYRSARNRLLAAEKKLRENIENVAALRRRLPPGGEVPEDYVFEEVHPGTRAASKVRLSGLFRKGGGTLLLYSLMYGPDWKAPCPLCTSIADGFNGYARHVTPRVDFAVVSKAPPRTLKAWARKRGWKGFRLLSAYGNTYQKDYLAQLGDENDQWPLLNVFVRKSGKIRHFWGSELFYVPGPEGQQTRHVDLIWPMWNLFDLTPEGRGDWLPRLKD